MEINKKMHCNYCPGKVNLVKKTSLAHHTLGERIDDFAASFVSALQTQLPICVYYRLALDESTNESGSAQLVIFIGKINGNFDIIE